ncbi:cupin domain-containing protein [Spirosoma lituiforme]
MNDEARIYLAERRGVTELDGLRSYHYFNFAGYKEAGREVFGEFMALNQDILAPENSTRLHIDSPREIILLPIVGGIEVHTADNKEPLFASSGQVLHMPAFPDDAIVITNPYPDDLISFLQIWLKKVNYPKKRPANSTCSFNIDDKDKLVQVFHSYSGRTTGFIGKFNLRSEGVYRCNRKDADVLGIAIAGAFEFQGRLLQPGDALKLKKVRSVLEFEALSHDAVLLLIETR